MRVRRSNVEESGYKRPRAPGVCAAEGRLAKVIMSMNVKDANGPLVGELQNLAERRRTDGSADRGIANVIVVRYRVPLVTQDNEVAILRSGYATR